MSKHYRTIVLSDVHLGSKWSKTKEASRFLKNNSCETLILCGDIIDGWAILRGKKMKWKRSHTNFMKVLLDIAGTTRIIYVRGNHDDFLDRIIPISFLNISIVRDYIHTSGGKRYYVLHGDVFDRVTSSMKWLAKAGDVGYSILLALNKTYNHRRIRKGLPYYSIAGEIKQKVKASVSYISDFDGNWRIHRVAKTSAGNDASVAVTVDPQTKMKKQPGKRQQKLPLPESPAIAAVAISG